jgi:hypothetical protein
VLAASTNNGCNIIKAKIKKLFSLMVLPTYKRIDSLDFQANYPCPEKSSS